MTTPKPKTTPSPKTRRAAAKAPNPPVPVAPSGAPPSARPPRAPRPDPRRSAKPKRPSPPSQRFRPTAWKSVSAILLTSFLLPALAIGGFALLPGSGSGQPVEIDWPSPADPAEAARRVAAAGLVRSELLAYAYFALAGGASSVETGTHLLQDDMSPRTLWRRLLRMPGGATVRVTIPEGFNKFEIARRLQEKGVCSAKAFVAATTDPTLLRDLHQPGPDIEGFLFPATYELPRNAAPAKVIRRLALEADRRYADVFEKNADALHALEQSFGWSRRDVVNLASIVEKEAAVDDERPIIASVFLNRLRDPKFRPERRLQSDPTAVYGCLLRPDVTPTCAHADRGATGPMVRDPLNPYSTYAHPGLPPGPIANPSLRSIEAVLHPAATKYFYFVAKGGGRHTFSETYAEHRDAVPPAP